jgi:hypothetical protein
MLMSMSEEDRMHLVPISAGGTLSVQPTESGFQLELWFTDREAIVRIPLTREETGRLAAVLSEVTSASA